MIEQNPLKLFGRWFALAQRHVPEADAAALATTSREGHPAVRIVLIRHVDANGFVFFTNYHSSKAHDLEASQWAAIVFWWKELAKQVRIEGRVEKVPAEISDAYFKTRTRGKRLATLVSNQSDVIDSITSLEQKRRELKAHFAAREIPRPANWGGYRIVPQRMEFWKKGKNRVHKRLNYRLNEQNLWIHEFLAP